MIKQTVKNYKIINLFINQIRKRKINLIIPKRCDHDLIIPNYSNLGFNLIILKNNDYSLIVPNI